MKLLEIKTPQNVIIQYELADLKDRILAKVIDWIFILLGCLLIALVLAGILSLPMQATQAGCAILILGYTPFFEWKKEGKTRGKSAMNIQVIKLNGYSPDMLDVCLRSLFGIVDIYFSLGSVAAVLIGTSQNSQRLGDMVAQTTVVSLKNRRHIELSQILKLHSTETYTPLFPQAKKLSETDMLLIKQALERYKTIDNEAHEEAISLLCEKIQPILELNQIPENKAQFLQTLVNDYVVLTR